MNLYQLRTNLLQDPLCVDSPAPEFSWKISATSLRTAQSAYAIEVATTPTFTADSIAWKTSKIASIDQFGIVYAGAPLSSFTRYYWRLHIWDQRNTASDWSEPAFFETAALDPSLWSAKWISPVSRNSSPAYLHATLTLPIGTAAGTIYRGRAYASALGWYRLLINGHDVTGDALVPRWTPFDQIVEYQACDVGRYLQPGANSISIVVGDGRFRGFLGMFDGRERYGDRLAAWAHFEMELEGGERLRFGTGKEGWWADQGTIVASDPRLGEHVDMRIRGKPAEKVEVVQPLARRLVAESVERVRCVESILAKQVFKTPSGKHIVDFGQNFAGWIRIKLHGPAGRRVMLTYSEVLTKGGELDTGYLCPPLRLAPQQDSVILADEGLWFETWFTIHGFRYVEIQGLDHLVDPANVQGKVVHSSFPRTGHFACSSPAIERIYRNLLWSVRSNFTDIPTDCPTRERSGWTGDIQVFAPAATMFFDCQAFFRHYLRSLSLEQLPDGTLPPFVPSQASEFSGGMGWFPRKTAQATGWGDAAVLLPWTVYRYYGDLKVLRDQYASMQRWVDQLEQRARTQKSWRRWLFGGIGDGEKFIVDTGFDWGEWLRPGEGPAMSLFHQALVGNPCIPTAYLAHSSSVLSKIAKILGLDDDATYYETLATSTRNAWRTAFVRQEGLEIRIGNDTQDEYVRALSFKLLEPEQEAAAISRLCQLIEHVGFHLGTGFLSTVMLLPTLTLHGRADVAFRLLLQDTKPSWLGLLEKDATTFWETWEGYDSKGNASYSHNHYALGAFAIWLEESLVGLIPAEPGYRRIRVAPLVGGGITSASASRDTPFGLAKASWELKDGIIHLEVEIPPGTTADVYLGSEIKRVGSGGHKFEWEFQSENSG